MESQVLLLFVIVAYLLIIARSICKRKLLHSSSFFLSFLAKRDASGKYDKSGIPTINHTNPACTTCQVKFNLWSLMLIYEPLFNIRLISTIVQEE